MLFRSNDLGGHVVRISVTDMREGTFYARILIERGSEEIELDARPSDAIALALRSKAPIFVADEVIEASAILMEDEEAGEASEPEQIVEDFKRFLDDVRPEDFGAEG